MGPPNGSLGFAEQEAAVQEFYRVAAFKVFVFVFVFVFTRIHPFR